MSTNNILSEIILPDEESTYKYANTLSGYLSELSYISLQGNLGAGKTTLVRGLLRAKGYEGVVKSPTYNLVETYKFDDWQLNHFDLYRLQDPEELFFMGYEEYFADNTTCCIEWSERASAILPIADWEIELALHEQGRMMTIKANTDKGLSVLHKSLKK